MGVAERYKKNQTSNAEQTLYNGVENRYSINSGIVKDIENSVNTWLQNNNNFISNAQYRAQNKGGYVADSGEWLSTITTQKNNFDREAERIKSLVAQHKDVLDPRWVHSINSLFDENGKTQADIVTGFTEENSYWNQWENEEAYNEWYAWEQKQKFLLHLDVDEAKKQAETLETTFKQGEDLQYKRAELVNLKNRVESDMQYKANAGWDVTHDKGLLAEYESQIAELDSQMNELGDWQGLKEKAAKLREDATYATYKQMGKQLKEEALSAPDFETNNKYGTQAGGVWFGENPDYIETWIGQMTEHFGDFYDAMNEEEKKILGYYLANNDDVNMSKASDYLYSIEEDVNARIKFGIVEEKDTAFEKLLFSVSAGLDQFGSGMSGLLNAVIGEDRYQPSSATQMASQEIRQNISDSDGFWNGVLGVAYDFGSTTANMLPSILVGMVNPTLGTALMGASAGGNAYNEMINLGYSKNQARAYGTMVGASEALLEKALGGMTALGGGGAKLTTKMLDKVDKAFARWAIKTGGSMVSEFGEEALQTILEPWFNSIVTGLDYDAPDIDEVLYSGLLGALSAGVLEGGGNAINAGVTTYRGSKVKKTDGAVEKLKTLGTSLSADSVASQLAGRVTNESSAYTIGRLFQEVGATLSAQNKSDIIIGLTKRGVDESSAKKIADTYEAFLHGEMELTDEQVKALEGLDPLADVLRKNIIGVNTDVYQRTREYSDILDLISNKETKTETPSAPEVETPKAPQAFAPYSKEYIDNKAKEYEAMGLPIAEAQALARFNLSAPTQDNVSPTKENAVQSKYEVSAEGKTINTKSGEIANIKNIESISSNGEANLTIDDGMVVKASDLSFGTDAEALFVENIGKIKIGKNPISTNSANALYMTAMSALESNPNMTADEAMSLIKGLEESYVYGTYNLGRSQLTARNEDGSARLFAGELSQEHRKYAYELGTKDAVSKAEADQKVIDDLKAKANKGASSQNTAKKGSVRFENGVVAKGKLQKRTVSLAKHLARAIGIDIVFYDARTTKNANGKDANGYFDEDTDTIYLDLQNSYDDAKTIAFTLSHELVHFIKKWSPAKFNTFAKFLMENYAKHGVDASALLSSKMTELGTTDADFAYEEMICDACETMLLDSNAVYKLMELRKTDLELFDKIKLHIHKLLNTIRNMYKELGLQPTSNEAKALLGMKDVLEQMYALFEEASVDAVQNYQAVQNANESIFGEASVDVGKTESGIKNQLKNHKKIGEDATAYNDRHKKVHKAILQVGIESMYEMAEAMLPYLEEEGILPPDIPGKTIFKNGSYGRTGENTTLCVRTLTYEDFKDRVAEVVGRPLTVSESLLVSQKIYDIATEPQCIYCYVAADRKAYDGYLGEYWKAMDKYIKALRKGGDSQALYTEYLAGRKDTNQQRKRWSQWEAIAKSGKDYISAKDLTTKRKRDALIAKKNAFSEQIKDAQRYAQSASWAKTVFDYRAYKGDILKMTSNFVEMLNSEYGLRMYSFSDYTPAFIVENMQMLIDASVKGLKSLAYTKDTDYAEIFASTGQAINVSCFAKWDSVLGTYVEDNRQGANWEKTKSLRKQYRNVGAVMVATNDAMVEWALKQDWIDVVIPYHIVKTGTTIANEYQWNNYTSESADRVGNKTANIYPTEHNNDFATYSNLLNERGITPRFSKWYDKVASGELTEAQYMKLVNEVRLPASELSAVVPSFNLDAAKKSFGIDKEGKVIKGGFVDKGGYMGGWYRQGVDVNQEVMAVSEDIKAGKSSLDVDYGMSKAAKEKAEARYTHSIKKQAKKIRAGMSEVERYSVLKDAKIIAITDSKSESQPIYAEIEKVPEKAKGQVEKLIRDLADDLEILNVPLSSSAVNIEFQLSKNNGLQESLSQQLKYGGNFHDFSKALINLRDILNRAVLVEVHEEDRYKDTIREDINFEAGYVLFSAFKSQDYVIPVKLEIKQKKDVRNILYVVVSMTKIKRTSVMESALDDTDVPTIPLSDTDSVYSLPHLVSKINPKDRHFLKYLPDQMLSTEQSTAKALALKEDKEKLDAIPKKSEGVKKQLKKSSYAPTFYSQMGKVVKGVKQEKLAANSVVNMLRGKGVKAEEIRWSGIVPFLEGKKSITKQELLDFINGSMLQIDEQTRHLNNDVYEELNELWEDYFYKPLVNDFDLESGFFDGTKVKVELSYMEENGFDMPPQDVQDRMVALADSFGVPTKWDEYVLDGGTNYRELVFTMPNSTYTNSAMQAHWGRDAEGVLVHARIQDFNVKGKKMLFIEEIQSDWHNAGHKNGYETSLDITKKNTEVRYVDGFYELFHNGEDTHTGFSDSYIKSQGISESQIHDALIEDYKHSLNMFSAMRGKALAPDAPFKENYHEYVLKRLLRMAAEQGYDSIGWTPSEIQSDRWSDEFAEGYRIEYDQEMPKFLRKYGRQWGAKVDKTPLPGKKTTENFYDVNREIKFDSEKEWKQLVKEELMNGGFSRREANATEFIREGEYLVAYDYDGNECDRAKVTTIDNKVWSMDIPDSMKDSALYEGQVMYQKKTSSNRNILANALESVAENDVEKNKLAQYKEKIALIEAEEQRLSEIQKQLFTKGAVEPTERKALQFEAKQISNRINTYDRQLLNLESTTALKNVLNREKALAMKRQKQKDTEYLKQYKEKVAKTQRELLERNQESRKKAIEGREKTAMRHKIKGVVNDLNNLLLKPSKERHVPEEMRIAVAEALSIVNMDTVDADTRVAHYNDLIAKAKDPDVIASLTETRDRILNQGNKLADKLTKLKDAYSMVRDSTDESMRSMYDDVIYSRIESVQKIIGKTPLRNMTLGQLESVYDLYKMVLTTIRDSNKAFAENITMTRLALGSNTFAEIKEGHKTRDTIKHQHLEKFLWQNLKPMQAMKTIGSGTLQKLWNNILYGQETFAVDYNEAVNFAKEMKDKHGYEKWDKDKLYSFESKSGKVMKLNLEQMMSIYAYSKRAQADEHIEFGGVVLNEGVIKVKNKLGKTVEVKVNDSTAYRLDKMQVASIVATLDKVAPGAKAFVDEMQKYLSETMGAKGNEVSMKMYGVKLFKEEHYFPLKSSKDFMEAANAKLKGDVKIKNKGMTKSTVEHARNPIVLENFLDVWGNHINEMAMYHGLVLPLEDFSRTLNYSFKADDQLNTDAESVRTALHDAFGDNADNYLNELLKAINGGVLHDSSAQFADRMISKFKKSKVMASLSVIVQQPTAIIRAMGIIEPKYFVAQNFSHKATWEELKKYCPTAIIKETGSFDTNMGRTIVDMIKDERGFTDKVGDVLGKAPAYMDEMGWNMIWRALKKKVATEQNLSGEALLQECGKQMTLIINETQVYDSVMSRNELMRSKSAFTKMATAFMGEPTTVANMIYGAGLDFKRGKKGVATKTVAATIASVVINGLVSAIVYAMRDDDEEKTFLEKYISSATTEVVDGLNPLTYIPFVKDAYSLFQGYKVERTDMALIKDVVDAIDDFYNVLDPEEYEGMSEEEIAKHIYENSVPLLTAICDMFGLPVGNVLRDAEAIIVRDDVSISQSSAKGIRDAFKEGIMSSLPKIVQKIIGTESKQDKLYDAIVNGDDTTIERLKSGYKDEASYETAVRKALRENDERIKEAAEAYNKGDIRERDRILSKIVAEGNFDEDLVLGAITAEASSLEEDSFVGPLPREDEDKATSKYRADDINVALANGDTELALEIIDDLVKTKVENGMEEDKARSSVKSSVTSYWKPLYKVAYQNKDTEEMKRIRFILADTGLYGRPSEVSKTCQEWAKELAKEKNK